MRRRVKCSAAAAEQTDEQGEGTFRRINTGIIIILYRSSVASCTNSLILCRAVATGEEGEEVPDVETVCPPKGGETRFCSEVWCWRLGFGRFEGLVDPQLHRESVCFCIFNCFCMALIKKKFKQLAHSKTTKIKR